MAPLEDKPGMDSVVVPVPSREWALCAIEDLRREGLFADLDGQDANGMWQVRVEGPAGTIAEIRYGLQPPRARVCWETFVNAAVTDLGPTVK